MKIINLGIEIFYENKRLMTLMDQVFGVDKVISLYGVFTDDGKLDVVAKSDNNVLYIRHGEKVLMTNFMINDDYSINTIAIGNSEYQLGTNNVTAVRNGLIQENLSLVNDGTDENMYEGHVIYTQFNPETDVECTLRYDHRCMMLDVPRERIYEYHLKEPDFMSIEEKYKAKPFNRGFLGKRHKYFAKMELDSESYDYDLVAIKEYGLLEFVHNGSYSLLNDHKVFRYSKGLYLSGSGSFRCAWPLGYPYKKDNLEEIIKSYSFNTGIPMDILDVYNGDDKVYIYASQVMGALKEFESKKENKEQAMTLQLKPDKKE